MAQDTRKSVVAAVNQEPLFEQTIHIRATGKWHRLLQFLRLRPKTRTITIYPPFPATVFKLSELLLGMSSVAETDGQTLYSAFYKLNADNLQFILRAVAVAVHNSKGEPSHNIIDIITHHFSYNDLRRAIDAVHRGLDVENFFGIMASVRSIGISDMLETEAHGPHSEGSSNTTGSDGTK